MDDIYRRHGHLESHFLNDPSMSFLKDEEIIALAYQKHLAPKTPEPSEHESEDIPLQITSKIQVKENVYEVTYENNDKYTGELVDDLKEGEGIYLFEDGEKYDGSFQNNMFHGFGRYFYEKGFYEGDFYEGKRQGMGILKYQDEKYQGEFYNDMYDGKGILENKEGKYEGTFRHGMKQGPGILHEKDGNVIIGEWHQDQQIN